MIQTFIKQRPIHDTIVVVAIDDKTIQNAHTTAMIPRSEYTRFLQILKKLSITPRVIWIDTILEKRSSDDIGLRGELKAFKESSLNTSTSVVLGTGFKNGKMIPPYSAFSDVTTHGFTEVTLDTETKRVVSVEPVRPKDASWKEYVEHFAFQVLRQYSSIYTPIQPITSSQYRFGNRPDDILPLVMTTDSSLSESWNISLQWTQKYVFPYHHIHSSQFKTLSFSDIVNIEIPDNADTPEIRKLREDLRDKIVLIWYTDRESKDVFFIPNLKDSEPGVYVHANIINNILNGFYIVFFSSEWETRIILLFLAFLAYLNALYIRHWQLSKMLFLGIGIFLLLLILYIGTFMYFGYTQNIFITFSRPLDILMIFVCALVLFTFSKYITEDSNKHVLADALSSYVSSDIAQEILTQAGNVKLSGELKPVTIFFSDIVGFTTLAENMTPEELVTFLRIYLGRMSDIIIAQKWFINKYEWDAIMALWWAFRDYEDQWAFQACYAAVSQETALTEMNAILELNHKPPISIRMGIHVWDVILGNIGNPGKKMEYTALGDNVNLASRLENINRYYHTSICVSGDVYERVKHEFVFRYLDKIRVKGKNNSVDIYELITGNGPAAWMTHGQVDQFYLAIAYYQQRNFQKAYDLFYELWTLGDYPSKIYEKRCKKFMKKSPPEDWDMIWNMDEK